jgi:hypothetical protein
VLKNKNRKINFPKKERKKKQHFVEYGSYARVGGGQS